MSPSKWTRAAIGKDTEQATLGQSVGEQDPQVEHALTWLERKTELREIIVYLEAVLASL